MALGAFIMTVATHVYTCTRANLVPPLGTGKPHPDIFLEAARRIGCEPCNCRAYEDGESGLCAAYAARHIHFAPPLISPYKTGKSVLVVQVPRGDARDRCDGHDR